MRALFFRLHTWIGLAGALAVVVFGLTGSFLVFHDEADRLLNPGLFRVASPAPGSAKLPLDRLVEKAPEAWPGYRVAFVSIREWDDPGASLPFRLRKGADFAEAALDPYTGQVAGFRQESFVRWVLRLHYSFLLGEGGRAAAFFFAVALVLASITGLFIYRNALKAFAKALLRRPRGGRGDRVYLADLHVSLGLYALLFNLVLGGSGAWFNSSAVFGPKRPHSAMQTQAPAASAPPAVSPEAALAAAAAALPDLNPYYIALPRVPNGPYQVYGQTPGALFSHPTCSSVSIDAATGAVKQVKDFRKLHGFDKFLALLIPLHFGNFGGWPIQVIYCLGGLAPAVLSVSGVAIWVLRKRTRNGTAS